MELAEQLAQQRTNVRNAPLDHDTTADDDTSQTPLTMSPQEIFQQMGLGSSDLSIVLGTAERLLPSITEFVRVHLGVS